MLPINIKILRQSATYKSLSKYTLLPPVVCDMIILILAREASLDIDAHAVVVQSMDGKGPVLATLDIIPEEGQDEYWACFGLMGNRLNELVKQL